VNNPKCGVKESGSSAEEKLVIKLI